LLRYWNSNNKRSGEHLLSISRCSVDGLSQTRKKFQAMKNTLLLALAAVLMTTHLNAQSISMTPQLGSTSPALEEWSKKIATKIIAMQEYPRSAQVRGAEGIVKVRVLVDATGKISSMEIAQQSSFDVLNREATKTIERAAPFPAPPGGSSRTVVVPMVWKLNNR
jgi:periplasmic protein TonB